MTPRDDGPLRVALLGYGLAGRVFHAPLISTTAGMQLVSIVTGDPDRADQAAHDHPEARVLSRPEEVWAAASGYDLAVVATANIAHVPQAMAAIESGLHVVVDKPMAADATQAQQLMDLAGRTGVTLHAFQNRRWDSDVLTAAEVIGSGALGKPHRLESRIERWRPNPRGVWRESAEPDAMGGQLYDLGVHAIDQSLGLLGPAIRVHAVARSLRDPEHADDDSVVTIEHANGAVSSVTVSAVAALAGPRFRVLGTGGALLIEASDSQEDALRAGRTPLDPDWGAEPESASALLVSREPDGADVTSRIPLARGRWQAFYAGVRDSIVTGTPSPVDPGSVVATMRVLDAARLSAAQHRVVDIEPSQEG